MIGTFVVNISGFTKRKDGRFHPPLNILLVSLKDVNLLVFFNPVTKKLN
jgi:hypothetical protein